MEAPVSARYHHKFQLPIVSIVLAAGFFFAFPAHAATRVQTKTASATAGTALSVTLDATATAGDMLIAVVGANGSAAITGPAGWSTAVNESGTGASQGIFFKRAVGNETTVSASVNTNPGAIGMHVYEYSGATTYMGAASQFGSGTSLTSGTVSTTAANELVLAAFVTHATATITNATWNDEGFTEWNDFTTASGGTSRDSGYSSGDNLTNAAGAKTVTVTASTTGAWRGQIVRFQNDVTAPAPATLSLSDATLSSIKLTWAAPGDDGTSGTANSYDVRYSTSAITNDTQFNAATAVTGEPSPAAAGTVQTMTVGSLSSGTLYYFAMKTSDEVPNVSALSNSPGLATLAPPDVTAPAAVSDLALSGATVSAITLTWTAPGDDGTVGTAASYDIRRATSPITNDADFAAATAVTGEPSPAVAGTVQTMTVGSLSSGTLYYFAMKTSDEVPNVSALSNSPGLATLAPPDVTAPAAVSDLAASSPTTTSIVLTWTAPGDDGTSGTASLYDIHYSTSPILSDADYIAASDVTPSPPAPAAAGTVQTMTVTGLTSNTTYYFALKTYDEVPNVSALSNAPGRATLPAPDTTAPDAVTDLAASAPTTTSITLTWTAPGDDGTSGTAASYDIRYSTSPIANGAFSGASLVAGEPAPAIAGTVQTMTVDGLSANTTYYFAMKTSDEAPNVSALSNNPSRATLPATDAIAPAAVSDFAASSPTTTSVVLTWTAPGDDGSSGTAASYDIRYSDEYSITSEAVWIGATQVTGEPLPTAAGTSQAFTVTGLTPNRNYHFAMKTSDEVPNVSPLSNSPSLSTLPLPDSTAPAAVADLAASSSTTTSVVLTWTAPGDDGSSGTAAYYDIHYSTSPLTGANFESATHVTGEPSPAVAGTVQSMTVGGLTSGTTYYFAMKTADEVPNASGLSNVPSGTTLASPDVTAPAAVADLAASSPTTTSVVLTWTAPGDDGSSGTAVSYDIRYSTSSIANGAFVTATQVTGEPAPAAAGTVQSMTVGGLSPNTTYYFAMKTSDEVPNVSGISNVPNQATLAVPDATAPSAISTLTVTGVTADSVSLSWMAPGDDGSVGTASSYDVRYSTSSITSNVEYALATQAAGEPVPAVAGTAQSFTVNGLTAGTTYFFAIKAADEIPNESSLSNTVSAAPAAGGGGAVLGGGSGTDLFLSVITDRRWLPVAGGDVTFTYEIVNQGPNHITGITVSDNSGDHACAPVQYLSGDVDFDGMLDTGGKETWTFTCTSTAERSHSHTAIASGYWNYGLGTSNPVSTMIIVGPSSSSTSVHFHAEPHPAVLHPGGGTSSVALEVGNLGVTDITDITFSGGGCAVSDPVEGDDNGDGRLNAGEEWEYVCIGEYVAPGTGVITFSGMAGDVQVSDIARFPVHIGEEHAHSSIHLHVIASPAALPVGGGTTNLTYLVSNDGNVPLTDVVLESGSDTCVKPKYLDGDDGRDGILGVGERWRYTCVEILRHSEADAATVRANSGIQYVSDDALFVVSVAHEEGLADDPTVVGPYDPDVARSSTTDIDTNLSLKKAAGAVACVVGLPFKLADDGDPKTDGDTTVYYCGRDGLRHPFVNRKSFLTWFADFSMVRVVAPSVLRAVPLGADVTYRPGVRLLKTPEDPKVYAVARGGILRWLVSEAVASAVYGPNWQKLVDDISRPLLDGYLFGENITR